MFPTSHRVYTSWSGLSGPSGAHPAVSDVPDEQCKDAEGEGQSLKRLVQTDPPASPIHASLRSTCEPLVPAAVKADRSILFFNRYHLLGTVISSSTVPEAMADTGTGHDRNTVITKGRSKGAGRSEA